jgi:hypothetical protein
MSKYNVFTKYHWAFGRSLDKSAWILTGVLKLEAPEVQEWLNSYGAKITRIGCTVKTRHYWFAFSAPKEFVIKMAQKFPIPNGAKPLVIRADGRVQSKKAA